MGSYEITETFVANGETNVTNRLEKHDDPEDPENPDPDNFGELKGQNTRNDNEDEFELRPEKIVLTIKRYRTGANPSTAIAVQRNGAPYEITVTEADGWAWSVGGLPYADTDGTVFIYTVSENPDGDGLGNGKASGEVESYEITETFVANGETDVKNRLKRHDDPEDPEDPDDEKKFGELIGAKTWNDDGNKFTLRPESISLTIMRYREDQTIADAVPVQKNGANYVITVTEADDWQWSVPALPFKDTDGTVLIYTVKENGTNLGAYAMQETFVANGETNVTNTLKPTELRFRKQWSDNNNSMTTRPNSITVKLMQAKGTTGTPSEFKVGGVVQQKTLTASNWAAEQVFDELPAYAPDGTAYVYSIQEEAVSGYKAAYALQETEGTAYTLTNTLDTVAITITKMWNDLDNVNTRRPATINFVVKASDNKTYNGVLRASTTPAWTTTLTVPKYDKDFKLLTYSVSESTKVNGYATTNYNPPAQSAATTALKGNIVNNLELVNVRARKVWSGVQAQEAPEITVNLLRNNQVIDSRKMNVNDGWDWTFRNLMKYDESGTAYVYSVIETTVPGYQAPTYKTLAANDFEITNAKATPVPTAVPTPTPTPAPTARPTTRPTTRPGTPTATPTTGATTAPTGTPTETTRPTLAPLPPNPTPPPTPATTPGPVSTPRPAPSLPPSYRPPTEITITDDEIPLAGAGFNLNMGDCFD
jgi:hypothetical protein